MEQLVLSNKKTSADPNHLHFKLLSWRLPSLLVVRSVNSTLRSLRPDSFSHTWRIPVEAEDCIARVSLGRFVGGGHTKIFRCMVKLGDNWLFFRVRGFVIHGIFDMSGAEILWLPACEGFLDFPFQWESLPTLFVFAAPIVQDQKLFAALFRVWGDVRS